MNDLMIKMYVTLKSRLLGKKVRISSSTRSSWP